jgi:type VI secretion system protein ImpG
LSDDLLPYYQRELAFIRRLGDEFARANPKIAGRLRIAPDAIEDPHVGRLIEAFALLNARTRRKLDDDFPELTQAMLGVLYPHYLAPIPSMAIVQFVGRAELVAPFEIPAGAGLATAPVDGEPCRFRTAFGTTVLPIEIESAKVTGRPLVAPPSPAARNAVACLRLVLRCKAPEGKFSALAPGFVRLHLRGAWEQATALYELLMNDAVGVAFAKGPDDANARHLPETSLVPVGFDPSQGMLPYPPASFAGYRLLTEFFAFPSKFLFVDLTGLTPRAMAGFGERLEVYVYLRRSTPDFESQVSAESFALGCAPIVNLFRQRAEPILVSHTQSEYRIVPDAGRPMATEIYSVDSVSSLSRVGDDVEEFLPFFSVRHAQPDDERKRFFTATRRPAERVEGRPDPATEVFASVMDLDMTPLAADDRVLSIETTCLNRNVPSKLPFGGDQPKLTLEGGEPVERIRCLTKPTPTLRPPLGHGTLWRLVSHLSLNHLSIAEGDGAADALREILRLYDFRESAETRASIEGIASVSSRPSVARAPAARLGGVCRGVEVRIEFDPERYSGGGMFLFASVLERFLGLYCSVNSFTRAVAVVKGKEGELRRWPPRAGDTLLI